LNLRRIYAFLCTGALLLLTSCSPRITGSVPDSAVRGYRLNTLRHLGSELKESSGLCYFDNRFWSINDSGGGNILYSFGSSKSDSIEKHQIGSANNRDWESLDDDSLFVYIADVGDNFGTRKPLFIYRISKAGLNKGGEILCDTIRFQIPEKQVNPQSRVWSSHDCEAIVIINDSIYLFTKNWIDFTSSVYVIPAKPGSYSQAARSVVRVNMLVTGADYEPCSGNLFLVGYMKYKPAMVVYPSYYSGYLADKPFMRVAFPARFGTQTEAVSVSCAGEVFISSERSIYPARLFQLHPKE